MSKKQLKQFLFNLGMKYGDKTIRQIIKIKQKEEQRLAISGEILQKCISGDLD